MKSVMLYFGSFNPVHRGHIAIAQWVLDEKLCDEIWFVVSPQNPLKSQGTLIDELHRLKMVETAIKHSPYPDRMRACDAEFRLPRPSYTIDTLKFLDSTYPETKFSLLVGSDIVEQIEKWREWQKLLNEYKIYVYPRRCYKHDDKGGKFILLQGAPYEDYSSTQVRNSLCSSEENNMTTLEVSDYIRENKLWTDMKTK